RKRARKCGGLAGRCGRAPVAPPAVHAPVGSSARAGQELLSASLCAGCCGHMIIEGIPCRGNSMSSTGAKPNGLHPIENGLHARWDGTLKEDAGRVRKGSGAQVMAVLRNLVIDLGSFVEKPSLAATRHFMCHPEKSLELVSTPI